MAVIAHTLHREKAIYLVPFPFMAEDKYNYFNQLYTSFGLDIVISSQNQKENDKEITDENYDLAVMVYEKFNYFLSTYPDFLKGFSLLIINEIQVTNNDYQKACLLKSIINVIRNKKPNLKIIALSSFTSNCLSLKKLLSARLLTSLCHPTELRKGIVREGVFKYIEHNTKKRGKEVFFKTKAVRDNFFEDYLKETVNYFIGKNESTLLFFPTCQKVLKWAFYLSSHTNGPRANQAIDEFYQIKDTLSRSRKNLLILLEKGIAYYNSSLTRKEKKLIETYVRKGETQLLKT
jgi:helicase